MTEDLKSNGSDTLEVVIEENAQLRATLHGVLTGTTSKANIRSALDYDEELEQQYIGAQWWFKKKQERNTKNKSAPKPTISEDAYGFNNIRRIFSEKGYTLNADEHDYTCNIVGVRSKDTTVNVFNDFILLFYWYRGRWVERKWSATTDPGSYWLTRQHLSNAAGTAILTPGQYNEKYTIRKHRGRYDAVCQKWGTTVPVYRDNDRDGEIDYGAAVGSAGGINIHRADRYDKIYRIDSHSAGCQVFQDPEDFDEFMGVMQKSKQSHGNSFSYTLISEYDLA